MDGGTLTIVAAGDWRLKNNLPAIDSLRHYFNEHPDILAVRFDTQSVSHWDTGLCIFLLNVIELSSRTEIQIDQSGLPEGVRRLLVLATAVPQVKDTGRDRQSAGKIEKIGQATIDFIRGAPEALNFLGEAALALVQFFKGQAQYKRSDLFRIIQEVGPNALPIVTLISFLVGLILAYMGAVQLHQFGAQIYIADLVGIGMVREMAGLMTGIIMAGRSGAAFAAQLGTMQVNEEIDALKTLGISPMEYLVLPRMLALIMMVPLLTLYGSIVGMIAGMMIAVSAFDVTVFEYYNQTVRALDMTQVLVGLSKASVYGVLIAYSGCLRGMQCGRSASAVGEATTSAVVTSIVLIVVSASILTIIFQALGI
ncbi:ABC-type transport system involved in resistance to organic solvents, permease component [hydrothermal vent metagenome]|uniref:ABC-type transport system involved in resistance to organic solvents, permease component n=1 Tax=hydrothermal vent metagenome TaxID=652676 RepID=A0A3B1A5U2_9ZZZZ